MPHLPTNELVGIHWIKSITGIPANSVGTTLPADNSTWEASGFIQVQMASGNPDLYLPMNQPVLQVDCWAAKPNSEKPPWGKANNLAELIKAATYEKQYWGPLTLPARSEVHTSELQSLMRISYPVFCLKITHNQTCNVV